MSVKLVLNIEYEKMFMCQLLDKKNYLGHVMSNAYIWLIYDKSDVCNSHFSRTIGLYM